MSRAQMTMIAPRPAERVRSGLQSASDMLAGLGKGSRVCGLTGGQFSLVDLLEAILVHTGPADVVIATWTAGVRDAEFARGLNASGRIRRMRLLVDRSFPSRQPQYVDRVREVFGDHAIRVTSTHAKFLLVGNDDWRVVVRTSMNLNQNRRIELFEIDEDAALYDWWMGEVVEPVWADMPEGLFPPGEVTHRVFASHWGHSDRPDDQKELAREAEAFRVAPAAVLADSGHDRVAAVLRG